MTTRLIAALVLAAALPIYARSTPPLWLNLKPGRFHAGYRRLIAATDPVDVWYPATNDGKAMTFRAYLHGTAGVLSSFLSRQGVSAATIAQLLDAAVDSRSNATPAPGRFPLVLIAQGNGEDAADQAILSEFLATHGYVVASVPSPTIAHPMTDEAQIGAFAEEQATALERASEAISKRFRVRTDRESIVGHSFGARAALLLAMRKPSFRAIVSLDGGIGTSTGVQSTESAPSFRPNAALPPLLHIYETLDAFMQPDFRFIEDLKFRSLQFQQAAGMHHIHFTTYGFAAALLPEIARVTKAQPGVGEGVVVVANSVLEFLNRQNLRRR